MKKAVQCHDGPMPIQKPIVAWLRDDIAGNHRSMPVFDGSFDKNQCRRRYPLLD
jgi:hypothetical protein